VSVDTQTAPEGKATLSIPDPTGDTRILWDPTNRDEVDLARAAFEQAKAKGMAAFAVNPADGSQGGQIREFDPEAKAIVMVRQLQGG